MESDFFNYYILSYFQTDKEVKTSQILHVLRGKKTPSMYYLTEVNQWHHGFSINKKIKSTDLKIIVESAYRKKWLTKKEKGFLLTSIGKEILDKYFEDYYFPKRIHSFRNIEVYDPFWERIQLFSQVFSEYSYKNPNYTAIIKDPHHQEIVRLLFEASQGNKGHVLKKWIEEQDYIFKKLPRDQANLLANSLTGHQIIGKTRKQLADELGMVEIELKFYLRDALEEVIKIIHRFPKKLRITTELLKNTQEEYYFSLSESTYYTFQMLKQGQKITEIARARRIKKNTVKEHLLEIAFVLERFPTKDFVPIEIYQILNHKFYESPDYSYREAVTDINNLEFHHYRLVELERMQED